MTETTDKVLKPWQNDLNKNAMSGSEMMMVGLEERLTDGQLDDFQIILSRPWLHTPDESKLRILWCHDLPEEKDMQDFLIAGGWREYHRLVFVSTWQAQRFIERYNIPWERTNVLRNAIEPLEFDFDKKWDFSDPEKEIRFVYHTTPHRGLNLLVPVFEHLASEHKNIHLDVFSSFKIYGWPDSDEQFKPMFDHIQEHENMTYRGNVPNGDLRTYLADHAHVFAYPCTWQETSCRALMEAMSGGLMCVHPNTGALFETAGQFTFQYHFDNDPQRHAAIHHMTLANAIDLIRSNDDGLKAKLSGQKSYADVNYSWEIRMMEWESFLNSLRNLPRKIEKQGDTFTYKVE